MDLEGFKLAPHNIWLQCSQAVACGQKVSVNLIYGHYFTPEGDADPAQAKIWLLSPKGIIRYLDVHKGPGGMMTTTFTASESGVWTVLAMYDVGLWAVTSDGRHLPGGRSANASADITREVHYRKYGKALVFCDVEGGTVWPSPAGTEMEITPLALEDGSLSFLAQLNGAPLGSTRVSAACRGRKISRLTRTGEEGRGTLNLSPGTWLVLIDYESLPVGSSDQPCLNLQASYSVSL